MIIGFIGFGVVGRPMARNLLRACHELTMYDAVKANVDVLVKDGARASSSFAVAEAFAPAEYCATVSGTTIGL